MLDSTALVLAMSPMAVTRHTPTDKTQQLITHADVHPKDLHLLTQIKNYGFVLILVRILFLVTMPLQAIRMR